MLREYFGMSPIILKIQQNMVQRCVAKNVIWTILKVCHS